MWLVVRQREAWAIEPLGGAARAPKMGRFSLLRRRGSVDRGAGTVIWIGWIMRHSSMAVSGRGE